MSGPTCCCVSLDRCVRCDLLVGLEGFHLMSVARTPDALVLDVESCNQLGVPWLWAESHKATGAWWWRRSTHHGPGSWQGCGGLSDAGYVAPRGIPCGPISSRVCEPHLMTLPVLRGFGCWGLMRGVWHHQDRRRRGPRELTGIVDYSRGGSSHGPLEWTWSQAGLAPCMRTG